MPSGRTEEVVSKLREIERLARANASFPYLDPYTHNERVLQALLIDLRCVADDIEANPLPSMMTYEDAIQDLHDQIESSGDRAERSRLRGEPEQEHYWRAEQGACSRAVKWLESNRVLRDRR